MSARILIVYNRPVLPPDHKDYLSEFDIVETAEDMSKIIAGGGYETRNFAYARDPGLMLQALRDWPPDMVFNLFEGEADRTETEIAHAALLEWMQVPFSGSSSSTLALCRDKVRTKYMLRGAGLPSAGFAVVDRLPALPWTQGWPAIVKPATQDASVGIDQASVVQNQEELEARVAYVLANYGRPALVEQFIVGREYHINLYERPGSEGEIVVVPLAEVRFVRPPGAGGWPVYTYEAKWNEQSTEYQQAKIDTGIILPEPLMSQVCEVCRAAYRLMGLRDYGRVDIRLTDDHTPYIIEVNPNPYLNSIVLVDGMKKLERPFDEFVLDIVRNSLSRRREG